MSVVDDCVNHRAIADGTMKAAFSMKSVEGGYTYTADFGDEVDTESLFLTFRKLIADQDDAFANRIFNLSYQSLTDDELRSYSAGNHESWKQAAKGVSAVMFALTGPGGTDLKGMELVKAYFNGVLFHSDPVLQDYFEQNPFTPQARIAVNNTVLDLLQVAVCQRNALRMGFERNAFDFNDAKGEH